MLAAYLPKVSPRPGLATTISLFSSGNLTSALDLSLLSFKGTRRPLPPTVTEESNTTSHVFMSPSARSCCWTRITIESPSLWGPWLRSLRTSIQCCRKVAARCSLRTVHPLHFPRSPSDFAQEAACARVLQSHGSAASNDHGSPDGAQYNLLYSRPAPMINMLVDVGQTP